MPKTQGWHSRFGEMADALSLAIIGSCGQSGDFV